MRRRRGVGIGPLVALLVTHMEVGMIFEDDADTLPGIGDTELMDAVEWLRREGYLSGEERPFEKLLEDG